MLVHRLLLEHSFMPTWIGANTSDPRFDEVPLLLERGFERTQIGAPIYIGAPTQIRARTFVRTLHAGTLHAG